jgi:hypothetical protein
MKTLPSRLAAFSASVFLLASSLFAFDNAPESTDPDLSLAFPLEQRGEQVVNSEDVLVNPSCVIPAGSVFLTIFVPPRPEDVDVKRQDTKDKKFIDGAYSRTVTLPEQKDKLSPAQKAAFDRATRDPWKSHMIYRAAMKQYRFDEMRLVFVAKGSDQSSLEAFDLPEGMFLGGDSSGIKILAIQRDSDASRVGLTAGTTLLKVNGQSLQGGLFQFQKIYYAEKKTCHESGKPLELLVQLPGGGGTKTIAFVPPRKLGLNDFFSASDVANEPAKKPETAPAPNPNPVTPLAP